MAAEIRLPPLGQTSDEMSIVEWYKKVGDRVEIAEPLLSVETDKATVEVESAEEGILLSIVAHPGEVLSSGALLAHVGAPEELAQGSVEESDSPVSGPVVPDVSVPAARPPANVKERRPLAAPAVRKLAATHGIDLWGVTGTGPGGVIQRADLDLLSPSSETSAGLPGDLSPVSRVRRVIARRLTSSVQSIPSFRITVHLDATEAQRQVAEYGQGLTYTHLLLRAVAGALREHPLMRRLWVEDGPSYRMLAEPNVGLAVAGDDSLFVVTIPAPDAMTLPSLVEKVSAAASRGRAGSLETQDQEPASITISNLGMFDVDEFDAIIDPDQNAILAVGSAKERVVAPQRGTFLTRTEITVTLTCDHRAVDGAQAARFLQTVRSLFQAPGSGEV